MGLRTADPRLPTQQQLAEPILRLSGVRQFAPDRI
jgi:hypothetical protein